MIPYYFRLDNYPHIHYEYAKYVSLAGGAVRLREIDLNPLNLIWVMPS
jgi:hypothetical protein